MSIEASDFTSEITWFRDTSQLTPEIIQKNIVNWFTELDSGKHKQGKGVLTRVAQDLSNLVNLEDRTEIFHVEHCCLGIAAEIAEQKGQYRSEYESKEMVVKYCSFDNPQTANDSYDDAYLPEVLYKALGFRDQQGSPDPQAQNMGKQRHSVASMNDLGKTFKQIVSHLIEHKDIYFTIPCDFSEYKQQRQEIEK